MYASVRSRNTVRAGIFRGVAKAEFFQAARPHIVYRSPLTPPILRPHQATAPVTAEPIETVCIESRRVVFTPLLSGGQRRTLVDPHSRPYPIAKKRVIAAVAARLALTSLGVTDVR